MAIGIQEVYILRFSDGTEFCYTTNGMDLRVPLLRRDGFFATLVSDAEELEALQLGVRVANLRNRTREDTPTIDETIEMGVIMANTSRVPDGLLDVVFSQSDTDFLHYRDRFLLPAISRHKKVAPKRSD